MKIVLDCNVIISAALNSENCRKVLRLAARNHECFISDEIEQEYFKTMEKPRFKSRKEDMILLAQMVVSCSKKVEAGVSPFRLSDPGDEIYIATAIAANADAIITGNKKHFPLPEYGGVKILSPRKFLEFVGKSTTDD